MAIVNIIIIIVLVIVLVWGLNNLFFKTNIIFDIMCDAKEPPQRFDTANSASTLFSSNKNAVFSKDIPETSSSNFMLSVWFYIENWGDNIAYEKNILFMSPKENAKTVPQLQTTLSGISTKHTMQTTTTLYKNINIALDKYENNLFIDIETYLDKVQSSTLSNQTNYTRYKIPNIPVQKWNNLTLSVDTRTLDVYLDGKLRNSFILHGLYKNYNQDQSKKNIYIGNMQLAGSSENSGFEGYITRIRYEGNSINPQDAYKIYKAGINSKLATSIFNKYRLKISFLEYNKEKGTITF
jgi:hypothetical protein